VTGNAHDAEDLVQDAFLKIWRPVGSYRAESGNVRTWMLTAVRIQGIDWLRLQEPHRRTQEKAEAPMGQAEAAQSPRASGDGVRVATILTGASGFQRSTKTSNLNLGRQSQALIVAICQNVSYI
jgi:RNA polymerase sigma factor (sigma-70 family)